MPEHDLHGKPCGYIKPWTDEKHRT
jgi:hypothetical protein